MKKERLLQGKSLFALMLFCCMFGLFPELYAQKVTVHGQITDTQKQTLPGVSVVVKGTMGGVSSDINGNYSITADPDVTLVFSFVGMKTIEVPVKGRTTINVVMQEDAEQLEEVVVIGYGTARKSDVTGSIASVRGDKLREVPATNISYALQNRIAGVDMTQTSSRPGANMQIRIRGTRSLSASNDPLIVLDGIPFMGNLSDINPSDIKSMDILKDASSTAIYGSRGANGVILISTFRGTQGTPAKVSYNGYFGVKTVFEEYPMMSGPELVAMRKAAGDKYTYGGDEQEGVNTNWQDELYQAGIVTSHDVNIQGGTNAGNYSFGAGYYLDESVIPGQSFERFSLRGSFDQGIGKFFHFGLSTNNSYNLTSGEQIDIYNVLASSPLVSPWNADGTPNRVVDMPEDHYFTLTKKVIKGLDDTWLNENKAFASYNTLYAEVEAPWVKGLKYRINIGLNYRSGKRGVFTGVGVSSDKEDAVSSASLQHEETTNWAVEHLLTYDRTFNEKHHINVVGMYSAEQTTYTKSHMAGKDFPADFLQYYNIGQAGGEITVDPGKQDYQQSGLMSWMGRLMYTYDNRYMLMATVRSDASSRLAKGHQWHTYPAVSLGWNMKQESFMEQAGFIDQLKIRAGYGETSNQSVSPYSTMGLLATRPYNFGDMYTTGYYVSALPNPQLGWEYSSTWNFGVDFAFLQGRLSGTIEYYIQKTHDLLLSVGLPATSGVSSYTANVGKTQNKGIELTLNATIFDNYNGWTWEAGINLYANRNKLTALSSGQDRDESNGWFKGHPIDVIYDYQKIGLWQEGDPYLDILEPGGNVGMIKVKYTGEYNPDGTPVREIGPDDRQVIDIDPDFQGGFNTRVAYKGFDLNIIGAFKSGGKLISSLHSSNGYLNMLTGRRGNVKVDYWTPENTGAKYPKPGGIQSGDNPKYGSTLGYFDASYMKIRTITLGYNFDKMSWLKNLGISQLRVYVTAQNPFVFFSPYKKECGLDPETNSYNDENVAVSMKSGSHKLPMIGVNAPSTRNYLFGINLTF